MRPCRVAAVTRVYKRGPAVTSHAQARIKVWPVTAKCSLGHVLLEAICPLGHVWQSSCNSQRPEPPPLVCEPLYASAPCCGLICTRWTAPSGQQLGLVGAAAMPRAVDAPRLRVLLRGLVAMQCCCWG